jgi:hypothetical protein
MTQTWTNNDRDRIVKYLNLTRDYYSLIESTLTNYEALYGASAITEVQSKLDGLDDYNDPDNPKSIKSQMTDGSLGLKSVSVPSFHSYSQDSSSNLRATMALYNGDRQWLIDNLQLQNYASLSGKHTRA